MRHISHEEGSYFVREGVAEWIGEGRNCCRFFDLSPEVLKASIAILMLGIEKYPHIVCGGLTRTEHQPCRYKFIGEKSDGATDKRERTRILASGPLSHRAPRSSQQSY